MNIYKKLRLSTATRFEQRLARINSEGPKENLYILPSLFGWAFALVVFTLFLGAINYQISSIFFFTFFLATMAMVSAWQAHYNLKKVIIRGFTIEDAFKGIEVKIVLTLSSNKTDCFAVEYGIEKGKKQKIETISPEGTHITLFLTTHARGRFKLPLITFYTYFPLGLFRAWRYVNLDTTFYVYPQTTDPGFWPSQSSNAESKEITLGDEELYDLKQVSHPWAQPGKIAWKIAARGLGWHQKILMSPEGSNYIFRLEDSPSENLETKLEHLAYWLVAAEQKGWLYGLELPGVKITLSQGSAHLTSCLRQLAVYNL